MTDDIKCMQGLRDTVHWCIPVLGLLSSIFTFLMLNACSRSGRMECMALDTSMSSCLLA